MPPSRRPRRTRTAVRRPVLLLALLALLAVSTVLGAGPARARACGALLHRAGRLRVAAETSIVTWDGDGHERIVMRLDVRSDQRRAAWLMPTPSPADVRLGKPSWFPRLGAASAPRTEVHHDWWPSPLLEPHGASAAGPAGGGVRVRRETDLGPFHVASLSADTPGALAGWLHRHGYRLPGDLAAALRPYVTGHWSYTAIRLRAAGGPARLSGELTALSVSFHASSPVYPMRLSALAEHPEGVLLYVLAPHRMRPGSGGVPLRTIFAGRYGPSTLTGHRPAFLTTLSGTARPGEVTGDIALRPAARDTPYRGVAVVTRPVYLAGVAGGPALVLGGVLLLAVVVAIAAITLVIRDRGWRPQR